METSFYLRSYQILLVPRQSRGFSRIIKAYFMREHPLQAKKRDMLRRQLRARGIADPRVLQAMEKIPREQFVPYDSVNEAYDDRALGIGYGQTISQPYIVALMSEALELDGSETVLEIGTGCGYQTAILAELAHEVLSVERLPSLAEQAQKSIVELGYHNVTISTGDGTLGWPQRAPFARIIVTAMAAACPPALFEQLAEGGILVIPLGDRDSQILEAIRKVDGCMETTALSGCRFVPLIGEQGWSR
jgi:protein-L-isoaspartate(D-aspartate) O-methyltransferase